MSIIQSITVDDSEFLQTFDREWSLFGFQLATLYEQLGEELFGLWMKYWHRQYAIKLEKSRRGFGIEIDIWISNKGSEASGSSPYDKRPPRDNVPSYVNYGARRHAVMTQVFSPKTAVGVIQSFPGVGGSIRTSSTPVGTVEARRVDEPIADKLEAAAETLVDEALGSIFG